MVTAYNKVKEYSEKALVVTKEIGDKRGEASCYENLGTVYSSFGEFQQGKAFSSN